MNADYCVNLEVGEINSSGGWSDMADLAGHHSFPDGMTEYGYDGYTTGKMSLIAAKEHFNLATTSSYSYCQSFHDRRQAQSN